MTDFMAAACAAALVMSAVTAGLDTFHDEPGKMSDNLRCALFLAALAATIGIGIYATFTEAYGALIPFCVAFYYALRHGKALIESDSHVCSRR